MSISLRPFSSTLYIYAENMRRLWSIARKYLCLCLLMISLWILIYKLQERFNHAQLVLRSDSDAIYSYFKAEVYRTSGKLSKRDVLLVLRTSKGTQHHRMPVILKTWFHFSPQTTYITTNGDPKYFDHHLPRQYHRQLIFSQCKQAHSIRDLCCNSAVEFEIFFRYENDYKWLCRFDDDQYVNVPLLIDFLDQFSPDDQALYIGKPSMKEPKRGRGLSFWFATYGGGVCFSRNLLRKIRRHIYPSQRFIDGCVASNYPDDTHIAYLLRKEYNINLTVAKDFHHHIESDQFTNLTNASNLDQAITFGFKGSNVPRFLPLFPSDTYYMETLHCLLYPNPECMRSIRILLNKIYESNRA